MVFLAWSTDAELRRNASSGGFVRGLLLYMLEAGVVDQVLIARTGPAGGGFAPGFVATDDPVELRDRRTASVYYPVDPWSVPLDPRLAYAATLLPCQVETLRALQARGELMEIVYVVELLCHHTPTRDYTDAVLAELVVPSPRRVAYRGDGWPGNMTVDGHSVTHMHAWGRHAAPMLARCRPCRRTCGAADWTVADPWGLLANMGDGKTLVNIHTSSGGRVMRAAVAHDYLAVQPVDPAAWPARMAAHARRRNPDP